MPPSKSAAQFFEAFEHKAFEINGYDAIVLEQALIQVIKDIDEFLERSDANKKTAKILGIGPGSPMYEIQKELLKRLQTGHFEAYPFRKA